jgi:hypothetical protein
MQPLDFESGNRFICFALIMFKPYYYSITKRDTIFFHKQNTETRLLNSENTTFHDNKRGQ